MKIQFIGYARMHELHELLAGKQVKAPQEALTVIDAVLREMAAKRCAYYSIVFLRSKRNSIILLLTFFFSIKGTYHLEDYSILLIFKNLINLVVACTHGVASIRV